MSKILLLNPNKWGRGITAIWIPSHSAALKEAGHEVRLFDCTFYRQWTFNEIAYNTANQQYKPTKYDQLIKWNESNIVKDLQQEIDKFQPDIIFWSGLSSHIHGEGEYVNIEYGNSLIGDVKTSAFKIAGGLQPMADPNGLFNKLSKIDLFTLGESEFTLRDIADQVHTKDFSRIKGIAYKKDKNVIVTEKQAIISDMDDIPIYDYSIFDEQILWRPYNGDVVKGVDYEFSRGCVYTCSYCVETVIQKYYGFNDSNSNGVLLNANNYLRNKSAQRTFDEMKYLHDNLGVKLFRCQDTNFLTIKRSVLEELASLFDNSDLDIMLYIETRPEGINRSNINLLKRLKVDGVGMGVEMSSEFFRKGRLHRFTSQEKIIEAYKLLKENNIKRTTYNIIGIPEETEDMILETITFNSKLDPDNMTVAFYSPYLGTDQQEIAHEKNYFSKYEDQVDGQLRSKSKSSLVSTDLLEFYKKNFVKLVRNGIDNLKDYKKEDGII